MLKTLFIALTALFILSGCNNTETERITIASDVADCISVTPTKCLLIKTNGKDEWEFFYGIIEGFNYIPGFEYVIEVKKEIIKEPAADQPSFKYIFVKEISRQLKDSRSAWV